MGLSTRRTSRSAPGWGSGSSVRAKPRCQSGCVGRSLTSWTASAGRMASGPGPHRLGSCHLPPVRRFSGS
eukprot:4584393-Alexandrium_andersonii.AAC.1